MESIGDFAQNLILNQVGNIKQGRELPPSVSKSTPAAPAGKDISNIQVPDSFVDSIISEGFYPQDTPPSKGFPEIVWEEEPVEETPEAPPTPQPITEETAGQLIPLLEEVKGLLQEMSMAMTTTGQIGTNLAGPTQDPQKKQEKSYGYIDSKPAKSKKDILKKAIRARLKK